MTGEEIQVENGYTRIHPAILEALAQARLTGQEFRAVLFLLRQTYGWNKKEDAISLSQWANGMGLKHRHHVMPVLDGLVAKRIIIKTGVDPKTHIATWSFNKYIEQWEGVTPEDNSKEGVTPQRNTTVTLQGNTTVTPQRNSPVTPQRNHNRYSIDKSIDRSIDKAAKPPARSRKEKPKDERLSHPVVMTYRDVCRLTPNNVQRDEMIAAITNVEVWHSVLTDWMAHGWRPQNVTGQLDRYRELEQQPKPEPKYRYVDDIDEYGKPIKRRELLPA